MSSLPEATQSLMKVFDGKLQEFTSEIDNVHMVWLGEIQEAAHRMFSSECSTEPELMPKTPSQKKTNRKKLMSLELNESRSKRRFSKGKRTNLRRSSVQMTLDTISELVTQHAPENCPVEPARRTRRNKTTAVAESEPVRRSTRNKGAKAKETEEIVEAMANVPEEEETDVQSLCSTVDQMLVSEAVVKIPSSERLSAESLLNLGLSPSQSASKIPIAASDSEATPQGSRRSVQPSLVVRHSLVGLRHSMTRKSVRRVSQHTLPKKKARQGNSTCSSSSSGDTCTDTEAEDAEENGEQQVISEQKVIEETTTPNTEPEITQPDVPEPQIVEEIEMKTKDDTKMDESPGTSEHCRLALLSMSACASGTDNSGNSKTEADCRSTRSGSKRRAAEEVKQKISTPKKNFSPPKKCLTSIPPHMRAFVQTVQKNQMLMATPGSLGRSTSKQSVDKQSASKTDVKERERQKWDALNKKIEQEEERKKKIEEERKKKREEMRKKRDERLKRVVEAREKGEQEMKRKIEEKLAQLEKKNDMMRVERLAEEKAKRKVANKRQEELELRKKREEAARQKKLQQVEEEERRHLELLAKRKAEEEREKARKQAEAARALELKREQERERERELERERERERQAVAEKERLEREKAVALQKEPERVVRKKERKVMEEKRLSHKEQKRAEEAREAEQSPAAAQVSKQAANILNTTVTKCSALNLTFDIEGSPMKTPVGKEAAHKTVDHGSSLNLTFDIAQSPQQSPQSYQITPKGQKVTVSMNPEDYGMDQNSDDSTDDESAPRKPIPSWAQGMQLQQAVMRQYYNPPDLHSYFGEPEPPKLEDIFQRTKPRFFKRTSSAVWHSPPRAGNMGD